MATLQDLRDHIKSDVPIVGTDFDAQVDNAIRSALRQYRKKRLWFLKTAGTLTLAEGDNTVSLPSDFSAPYNFNIIQNGSRKGDGSGFDYLTYDRLEREYYYTDPINTGPPEACAVLNGVLYVSHLSDGEYSIPIVYFKEDATLPTSISDTSVWFDEGYDAIRSLAMFIFKREAKGYTPAKEDGELASYYINNLYEQNQAYDEGKS